MSTERYNAFISYRHVDRDKEIAIKLQRLLEAYKPPKKGHYKNFTKIKKIFRDESELPTSGNLEADIKHALDQSDFLVVICSEETSKSPWCMQEIDYFKQLHNGQCDNILTLLVSGDPRKVFPKSLCYETRITTDHSGEVIHQQMEIEPLAANVAAKSLKESMKKLNTEFLRIAAPILGCSYDDLYQRHQKRIVRKIITAAAAIITFTVAFSIYAIANINMVNSQAKLILEKKLELEKVNEDLLEGNLKIEETNGLLEQKNDDLLLQIEETTKQKIIAEEQKSKAEEQKSKAEEQKIIAEDQKSIAEINEQKAIDNQNYANEQKAYAEENYKEAVKQEQLANKNRIQAEENLSIAEMQKNLAYSSQSKFLAELSNQFLTIGDRMTALMLALEGLPKNLDNPERPYIKQAENALRKSLISFEPSSEANGQGAIYQSILNQTNIIGYCQGAGSDRIYTISNDKLRLWNTQNGLMLDEVLINPNGKYACVTYQESDNYLLVKVFDYIYNEITYKTETLGNVFLIQKNKDSIILSNAFKNTKKMLTSQKEHRVICVLENNMPIHIDYDTGVIKEKKNLTKLFSSLITEDYQLSGDISQDETLLSICEVNYEKMHIASMLNGNILKTIEANIIDSCFMTDNSLLYDALGNIYRYSSGHSEEVNDRTSIDILNSREFMYRFDSLEHTFYLTSPDKQNNKSVPIGFDCDEIEISPDDKYAYLSSTETGSFSIVALSTMTIVNKGKASNKNQTGGEKILKFSPDRTYVLCYDPRDNYPPTVFDVSTGKEVTTLTKLTGKKISGASFLTDQRMFVRNENEVNIIELSHPDKVKYFEPSKYYSYADFGDREGNTVIYSNDYLYSYTFDVMDSNSGRMLSDWSNDLSYEGGFYDLKNDTSILLGINGRNLVSLLINKKKYTVIDSDKTGKILGSHISKDGQWYLLFYSYQVVIYNINTKDRTVIPRPIDKAIRGAVFHPDNQTVSMLFMDRIICYDANNGALIREIPIDNSGYTHMKVSPEGNCFILYSAKENYHTSGGSLIAVFNSYSGELLYERKLDNNLLDVNVSGDGTKLLLAFIDQLELYSLSSGEELQELPCPWLEEGDKIGCCSINYNGTKVLLHYPYSLTYIWDLTYDVKELVKEAKELLNERSLTKEEKTKYYLE